MIVRFQEGEEYSNNWDSSVGYLREELTHEHHCYVPQGEIFTDYKHK